MKQEGDEIHVKKGGRPENRALEDLSRGNRAGDIGCSKEVGDGGHGKGGNFTRSNTRPRGQAKRHANYLPERATMVILGEEYGRSTN